MRKTSAAQVHAARINLEKARKAKSAKAGQRRKPTSKEMTKWQKTERVTQAHVGLRLFTKSPVMRPGTKAVAFFPHKGVKYLSTQQITSFESFLTKNKPINPPNERHRKKRMDALNKAMDNRKVRKVLIKKAK